MSALVFTHAVWRVRPGNEESFVAAWSQLGQRFSMLPQQPYWGTLIRSLVDPSLFVSFGPWPSAEAVQAMREDAVSQEALERLRALCDEATPGPYEVVRHVQVAGPNPLPPG